MYRQPVSTPSRNPMDSIRPPKPPERPLVPYMRYSRKMWPQVRSENPEAQLWDIGRIIGQMWKGAPDAERAAYQQEYELEKVEYEKAMKAYNNSPAYKHYVNERNRAKLAAERSANAGRRSEANSGVYIQPVDEEDPYEMTMKRLAAIRYDRNNRLMAELFSSSHLPDTRTIVPQHRIEQLRKQGQQLAVHQTKLNDELKKLEDTFNDRKRAIQTSSEEFTEKLQKVAEERPQLGEDAPRYKQVHEEWQAHLTKAYEEYKARQEEIRTRQEAERLQAPVLYSLTVDKTPSPPANHAEDSADGLAPRDESENPTGENASEAHAQQEVTQNGDSHAEGNGVNNEDSNSAVHNDSADVEMRDDTSTVGGGMTDNDGASEISDANDEHNHSLDGSNGGTAE